MRPPKTVKRCGTCNAEFVTRYPETDKSCSSSCSLAGKRAYCTRYQRTHRIDQNRHKLEWYYIRAAIRDAVRQEVESLSPPPS